MPGWPPHLYPAMGSLQPVTASHGVGRDANGGCGVSQLCWCLHLGPSAVFFPALEWVPITTRIQVSPRAAAPHMLKHHPQLAQAQPSSPTALGPHCMPLDQPGAGRDTFTDTRGHSEPPVLPSSALVHCMVSHHQGLLLSCTTLKVCLQEARCCPQDSSWGHKGPMGATHCAPGAGPEGAGLSPCVSYFVCWWWLRLCSNIPPSQLPARHHGAQFAGVFAQGSIPMLALLPGSTCPPCLHLCGAGTTLPHLLSCNTHQGMHHNQSLL